MSREKLIALISLSIKVKEKRIRGETNSKKINIINLVYYSERFDSKEERKRKKKD